MITNLLIASTVILFAYIAISCVKFGVPKSVSDTFYLWFEKDKKFEPLFFLVMAATVFCLFPIFIEVTPDHLQFLAFLCPAALAFVGAAPRFKSHEALIHFIAAGLCALLAIVWMICVIPDGWAVVFAFGVLFSVFGIASRGKYVFWIELAAFVMTYAGIWYKAITLGYF